jgi:protein O-mannosyl-transferase
MPSAAQKESSIQHRAAEPSKSPASQSEKKSRGRLYPLVSNADSSLIALIAMLVACLFLPAISYDFVQYDDDEYVYLNTFVLKGFSWIQVLRAFSYIHTVNWHPLTTISHALDFQLYGLSPGGHHFTNIVIHSINCCLFYWLLRKTFNVSAGISTVAVLYFGMHPMRIESVVWVSERKDVLSIFFLFLTIITFSSALRTTRARAFPQYLLSLLLYSLALLSKSSVVIGAPLLLLLSWWPLRSLTMRPRKTVTQLAPFFCLALLCGLMTLRTHGVGGSLSSLSTLTVLERSLLAIQSFSIYAIKLFYPIPIAFFYPIKPLSQLEIFSYLTLLTSLTALAIKARNNAPYLLVGWLWYLVSLVLVSGLMQNGIQAHADRYSYLSHCGLIIGLACAYQTLSTTTLCKKAALRLLAMFHLSAMVVLCTIEMHAWRSTESLMKRAIEVTDNNLVAYGHLFNDLLVNKKFAEAKQLASETFRLFPDSVIAQHNLVLSELALGNTRQARTLFLKFTDYNHTSSFQALKADILLRHGRATEGLQAFLSIPKTPRLEFHIRELRARLIGNECKHYDHSRKKLAGLRRKVRRTLLDNSTDSHRRLSRHVSRCLRDHNSGK